MHQQKTKKITTLLSLALLLFSFGSNAAENLNIDYDGEVVRGYDVVAYFTMGEAKRGSKEFTVDWLGGKWMFVSAEHRDLFLADPNKYIPQYGGYCSSSARSGGHSGVDPHAWQIVEDKLYLFGTKYSAKIWKYDDPRVVIANKKWDSIKAGLSLE